jgi:hypothetical protein
MKNIKDKLTILSKIAKELNNKKVTWAIGASVLLYFKGIVPEFNDIDIMIAEEDVEAVKEVMISLGKKQAPNPNIVYKTRCFLEFEVDGVEIDLMAGFIVIDRDKEYYFPLKKEDIKDFKEIDGIKIPLQSLEEWRTYYQLMGRDEKVHIIDAWRLTSVSR